MPYRIWFKFCVLVVLTFFSQGTTTVVANESVTADNGQSSQTAIKATLKGQKSNTPQFTLDKQSKELLKNSGIQKKKLDSLLKEIRSYQNEHDEVLGVEVSTTFDGYPTLTPNPTLMPSEVLITPSTLKDLIAKGGKPKEDLKIKLSGEGAHFHNLKLLHNTLIRAQPPDSTLNGLSKYQVINELKKNCPNSESLCDINGKYYDFSQLSSMLSDPAKPKLDALTNCEGASDNFLNLKEVGKTKDFDKHCLAKVKNDNEKFKHFAVLMINDQPIPHCGAYRIGPKRFVSAMHCMMQGGKLSKQRVKNSAIYLFGSPKKAINFTMSSKSVKRFYDYAPLNGFKKDKDLPVYIDFVILEANEKIDDLEEEDFVGIVSKPIVFKEAVVPGYLDNHLDFLKNPTDWTKGIRVTKNIGNNYCRIYDVADKSNSTLSCLIHRCQAVQGFSGSPILQENAKGVFVIVGVHSRPAADFNKSCKDRKFQVGKGFYTDQPIIKSANMAAFISEDNLEQITFDSGG